MSSDLLKIAIIGLTLGIICVVWAWWDDIKQAIFWKD
jgi:hypothetical protein